MDHSPVFYMSRVTRPRHSNRLKSCGRVILWYSVTLTRLRLPSSSFGGWCQRARLMATPLLAVQVAYASMHTPCPHKHAPTHFWNGTALI